MKNKNWLFVLVGFLVVALVGWFVYSTSKTYYAKRIVKLGGHHSADGLMSFDKGYLQAWSKALAKKQAVFAYQGMNYLTIGGKLAAK